jgi:hypothetical protein
MKIALLVVLLSVALAFGQISTKTYPAYHMAQELLDGLVDADGVTTDAIQLGQYTNITLYLTGDTTGASVDSANQSDSCLTIYYQVKDQLRGTWTTAVRIDTVDRAFINVAGTVLNVMTFVSPTTLPAADYTRFVASAGVGDSLNLTLDYGGN